MRTLLAVLLLWGVCQAQELTDSDFQELSVACDNYLLVFRKNSKPLTQYIKRVIERIEQKAIDNPSISKESAYRDSSSWWIWNLV